MLGKISWLYLFLALGLLVCSGLYMVWSDDSRRDGNALIVEDREQDLGEQTLGTHTLELRVRNVSARPRRILGMTGH